MGGNGQPAPAPIELDKEDRAIRLGGEEARSG